MNAQRKFWGKAKRFLAGAVCASLFVCGSSLFSLPASARNLRRVFGKPPENALLRQAIEKLEAAEADADPAKSAGLTEEEINCICNKTQRRLQAQPMLIEIPKGKEVLFVGDVHGNLNSVAYAVDYFAAKLAAGAHMVFLGDYVDRGPRSIETAMLLFSLKIRFENQVWLLRGNHEDREVNTTYGLYTQCIEAFGDGKGGSIFERINQVFDWLPLAATIDATHAIGGKIFCTHGGIPQGLGSLDEIKGIARPLSKPTKHPIAAQLLWNDPSEEAIAGGFKPSARGAGQLFDWRGFCDFKAKFGIKQVLRAHQTADETGFKHPFAPHRSFFTLFSAPGYCGIDEIGGGLLQFVPNAPKGKKQYVTYTIPTDFIVKAPAA